jgi:hypothetical protein
VKKPPPEELSFAAREALFLEFAAPVRRSISRS